MKIPEDITEMLYLREQGWSIKRIARELGISKNTVRRYIRAGGWTPYKKPERAQTLDGLEEWLKDTFIQHHGNAAVVQQQLHKVHNITLSLRTVQRALEPHRSLIKARKIATTRFETPPGKQMQVDFGETTAIVAGEKTRLHLCVMTLGYSRRICVILQPGQRQMHWFRSFERAFQHFEGVPLQLLVDNPRALVLHHDPMTREVVFNETFRQFCRHWGITPRACAPYRARTKGKDERAVRYVKENAIAGHVFESVDQLRAHLAWWTREIADQRIHGTTGQRPIDRFNAHEKSTLQPIERRPPFERRRTLSRKVHTDSCVFIDTNAYSVPWRNIGSQVQVELVNGLVEIFYNQARIARHIEVHGRRERVIDPDHLEGVIRDTTARAAEPTVDPATSELARELSVYADAAGGEW